MSTQQPKQRIYFWISFILLFIQSHNEAFASHAQSADITYQCLGGNQYQISLSFYRDCAGVAAPNTVTIDISSASCGQNITANLNQIPGTGIEVSPICASMSTQCSGGSYPGVQEYKYRGIITLPTQCSDWIFSFNLCCRNASIGSILNPSSESIYVEAHLDNLNFTCNNSPTFSNPPIPFVCVGQPYCFNNGASDADGDSLSYTLITPETSPTTTVTYISPYTASQPVMSSPAVSFNGVTGDMCMTPTQLEVDVFAILVQEWRGGVLVGSVMRDIQLRTITCTNVNPYANGINNTGQYSINACAGAPVNFDISSFDVDSSQNVTITWNSGISGATFTTSGGARPVGTFSWTPTTADISTSSHCFTVTVQDDNCPFNGSQTYSFCITVSGIILTTTSTDPNCGASNGTAQVQVISGAGPFTYQWLPSGGTNVNQNGLSAGTYTVNVLGNGGCMSSASVTLTNGSAPGNIVINSNNVSCFGGNNGTATVNASGGTPPYTYLWSTGATTSTISGLTPGTYSVAVTTANGCTSNAAVVISQPAAPLTFTTSQTNVSCNGLNNGSGTIALAGGTGPYAYSWNTSPVQTTATAINLNAGSYTVMLSDANGCSTSGAVTITQPSALNANAMVVSNVTCYGFSNGFATVGASGGTGIYSYSWNTTPVQTIQSASGLSPGTYIATVTDASNCTATSSITITQPPMLTLSAAAFPVTCNGAANGQTVVIPAGGSPTYFYQWMPGGSTSASVTGLIAGTYSITVTDAEGCHTSAALTVTQPTPLIVTATGSTTICLGQSTTISSSASGGTAGYAYNWSGGVGAGAVHSVTPGAPTSYSVVATDANGCTSNTAVVSINVTSLSAENLTVSDPTSICAGGSTTIFSSVTGSTGPVTINWSGGLGSGNGPFTVTPAGTITYTVTVTDACANSITGTVPVIVNPLPVINVPSQTAQSCKEVTLNFMDSTVANVGSDYSWTFDDGSVTNAIAPSHTYTMSGEFGVTVTVTSGYGCVSTLTTTCNITIFPGSQAEFYSEGLDGTTISPTYKFHDASVNTSSYYWTLGDGSTASIAEPTHTYADKGIYTVTLYTVSDHGCKDSISKDVEIRPEFTIYIPNAFTPDGNNVNDYFTAKGDEITEFSMAIYDRWGEMIFSTDNIDNGWDGKANHGDKVSETGVYVYKIKVRDFEHHYHDYTGHVTLLASE